MKRREKCLKLLNIYGDNLDKIRRINQRRMERFEKLTTIVNRQLKPCSAAAEHNIDDDINN